MDQMNQPVSSPQATPGTRAAAFSVHIFTALGAGIGLLAMLEAVREHWAAMFAWLGLALVVDALDGPIARRFDVVRLQPNWSGEVLDLVVDFVTYVFVPAYAITASGMMLPTFVPFNVMHPVRVVRLRGLTLSLIGIGSVLAIYVLSQDFNVSAPVT